MMEEVDIDVDWFTTARIRRLQKENDGLSRALSLSMADNDKLQQTLREKNERISKLSSTTDKAESNLDVLQDTLNILRGNLWD